MNLTALQHSAFLQSLGWAIANSLWQAAVLWVAYLIINGAYKNASARFKNNLSTLLLSAAFIWFCITLFSKYFFLQNIQSSVQQTQIVFPEDYFSAVTHSQWNTLLNNLAASLPYLSVAYLLLLIFLSVKLINSYRYTYFIKLNGLQKPGVEWKLFTQRVAKHMGINKTIKLWISQHIDVPATIGFIKPVILIPVASVNQLSAEQLEAIILHELSHIKRNDFLVNLFISLIETILFFNPFIVLLSKIIKRERENCCDDLVIQYQYDRHSYASALLSLEQYRHTNFRLALTATSGKKQLLHRVKRIMEVNSNNTNFNYGQKLLALLLITGIFCSVSWFTSEKNTAKEIYPAKPPVVLAVKKINRTEKIKDVNLNLFLDDNKNLLASSAKAAAQKNIEIVALPPAPEISKQQNVLKTVDSKNNFYYTDFDDQNKTFAAAVTPTSPSPQEFNYRFKTFFNTQAPLAQAELKKLMPAKLNMERLRADLENENFSFSIDLTELQELLQRYQTNAEWRVLNDNLQFFDDQKNERLAPADCDQQQYSRRLQAVTINGRHITPSLPQSHNRSRFIVDSLVSKRMVLINASRGNTYSNAMTFAPSEERKIYNLHRPDNVYYSGENERAKTEAPAFKGRNRSTVDVAFKNGVIIVNGEKIVLPDTKKLIAIARSKKEASAETEVTTDPF